MKKVCSVILSALLLVSMLVSAIPASAEAAGVAMTLTVGTYSTSGLAVGDQFTVSISTSEVESIAALSMKLTYDDALLKPVSYEKAGYLMEFDMVDVNFEPLADLVAGAGDVGVISVSALKLDTIFGAEDEVILDLTFEAVAAITEDTAIAVYEADATNIDAAAHELTTVNGGVKIVAPKTGVTQIGEDYYYVNADGSYKTGKFWVTATAANGYVTAGWVYADETGRFYNNEFYTIDGVLYFMEIGQPAKNVGVREINGELYSLNSKGQVNIGTIYVTEAGSNGLVTEGNCYTDETGRFYNNEFATIDGVNYYMVKGRPVTGQGGVKEIDGDLYYVSWKGTILTGKIYVSNGNGLVEKGWAYTDETGRFYNNEFVTVDGTLYYMVKGRPMQNGGGVEEINGNLYYVTWKGIVLTGDIYVSNPNGYTVKGSHYTDETGRFYNEEIVQRADGKYYYMVNGRIYNTPGVKEIDGNLYYITWEGPIATGKVYVTYTNGIIETTGYHYTDETGRFLDNEFAMDGELKYYVVKGAPYATGGVLKVGDNYYYVSYSKNLVLNGKVKLTADNVNGYTDLPTGYFYTDAEGVIQF